MKCEINKLFEFINTDKHKYTFLSLLNEKISYGKFRNDLDKLNGSDFFNKLVYQSKIIISTEDDYSKVLVFFYALRCGIIPIILDPKINVRRVKMLIKSINPCGFVLDTDLTNRWLDDLSEPNLLQVSAKHQKKGFFSQKLKRKTLETNSQNTLQKILENGLPNSSYDHEINNNDVAYIMYTSGSTSDPKGVMISYIGLVRHLETLASVYDLNERSNILNLLMLEHADGIIQGPVLAAFCGGQLIRPVKFEIARIPEVLAAIYKYKVSHFVSVPAMLGLINQLAPTDYDDSFATEEFKHIISVSSQIELELWRDFETRFNVPLINVYGLTETVAGSFFCGPAESSYRIGTIGKPIDTEAKIVNDEGLACEVDESGELLLRGAHITLGYLNNEQATRELFSGDWMKTGDIASRDSDGFYKIVGRKKNIIISGGFNIQPEEVQEVLMSYPGIEDCYCMGLPDPIFGERLVAVYTSSKNVLSAEIESYALKNLESEKVPTKYIQLDQIPKGLSGKANKPALLALISKSSADHTSKADNISQGVKAAASKAFNKKIETIENYHNSKILDGWDSLAHLDFIVNLESIFDIKLKTAKIMTMNSIQTAINVVSDELKS